jgi:putative chitinase
MTPETLLQIIPKCPRPWAEALIDSMERYEINTPLRQAAFLAQVAHESAELTRLEENLNYSSERLTIVFPKYFPSLGIAQSYGRKPERIANKVYSNRMGNGDEASGDGFRYHGRGPIQLTGKSNYVLCGYSIVADLAGHPDLLLQPKEGSLSAGWFWGSRDLNDLADRAEFKEITKRINGGYNGLTEREAYYDKAHTILIGKR